MTDQRNTESRATGRRIALGIAVVCLGVVAACGGGDQGSTSAPATAPRPSGSQAGDVELARGRRVYVQNCARCHGTAGRGGIGPSFVGTRIQQDFPEVQEQVDFIARGRGLMPSFAGVLSEDDLRAVARYEREVLASQD